MRWLLLAGAMMFGSAACESIAEPNEDPDAAIQTDRLKYSLKSEGPGRGVVIPYVFHNLTGDAVYVVNCNGAFQIGLERLEGGEWQHVWSPPLDGCLSPPIVILPHGTLMDTLAVWGAPRGTNMYPQFDRDNPSGVYRIVWMQALSSYQSHLPFGPQIPLEMRVSNAFRLKD